MGRRVYEVADLFGVAVVRGKGHSLSQYPRFYEDMFDAVDARIGTVSCVLLETKGDVSLRPLMKAVSQIQEDEGVPCVVVSPVLSTYQRRALSQEGVAWLLSLDVFHVPFLGMACTRKTPSRRSSALPPQAFRLLAQYLEGAYDGKSTQEVSRLLGKSLSSVTGYFAMLDDLFPGIVGAKGRMRFLEPSFRSEVCRAITDTSQQPFSAKLPRKHYYRTGKRPEDFLARGFKKAGVTALAQATMLADDPWTTLAIGRKAFEESRLLEGAVEIAEGDDPNLLVEVWPYEFDDREEDTVLPLEIWLSLRDAAEDDERVAEALGDMLGV